MTKRTACALVVAAVVVTAGAASADHRQIPGSDTGSADVTEPNRPEPDRRGPGIGAPDAGAGQPLSTPGLESEGRIVGRVVHLDRDEGTVTLATERGMLVVQASPDDLANVAVGDFVVVRMAPGAGESPSASPDTADQPAPCASGPSRCP
jgi:hypothetical protein